MSSAVLSFPIDVLGWRIFLVIVAARDDVAVAQPALQINVRTAFRAERPERRISGLGANRTFRAHLADTSNRSTGQAGVDSIKKRRPRCSATP